MKATGIVRRIDDLGRVVVPKEIRRTLKIREGDPVEIYTEKEGEIILKKYSPVGEIREFARQYAESLSKTTGLTVCITDKNTVIAAAGTGKKELLDRNISQTLYDIIELRSVHCAKRGEKRFVDITDTKDDMNGQIIVPILCEGDTIGAVIITTRDNPEKLGETEIKLGVSAAHFLGKQVEV